MLFRTIDHYNIYNDELDTQNNRFEENECFICYEIALIDENKPIEMCNHPDYNKKCQCNGYIHVKCLNNWYEHSMKCPICRTFIEKKKPVVLPDVRSFFRYFCNKMTNFAAIFIFVYFTIEFYASIIRSKMNYEHSCLLYENSCILYTEETYREYRGNSNNY